MNDLMLQLDCYKQTHPNFVKLWKNYITAKKKSYENSIQKCLHALNNIENINDNDIETLVFLFSFQLILKQLKQ